MKTLSAASAIVLMLTPALAQTAGSASGVPSAGKAIVDLLCSACHLASSGLVPSPAVGEAPTFKSIAQRLPGDVEVLAAFIANPHPPMPNLGLSRQDIRDLLAYIATLKYGPSISPSQDLAPAG